MGKFSPRRFIGNFRFRLRRFACGERIGAGGALRRSGGPIVAAALLVAAAGIFPADDASAARHLPHQAPGEILVRSRSPETPAAARRLGARAVRPLAIPGLKRIVLPPGASVPEALARLREDPDVLYAEPNALRRLGKSPTDPLFPSLWGATRMRAPLAWDSLTDCRETVVALLDSGLDTTHPDLSANLWVNAGEIPGNGLDDDGNGRVDDIHGWDFVFEDPDPGDANGHGTHVAGTIAAVGENGIGVAGLCWRARLMVLRAFDASGSATVADLVQALAYARDMGARVVNASYTGELASQAEKEAIESLAAADVLVVTAAGNDGRDIDQAPVYPAAYDLPNVLVVAASDTSDRPAAYTNRGVRRVHVAAPGEAILSTQMGEEEALPLQDFESGTGGWALDPPAGRTSPGFDSLWALADSPAGDYGNAVNASLASPPFDLAGFAGGVLEFSLRHDIAPDGDRLFVESFPGREGIWTSREVWTFGAGGSALFTEGVDGRSAGWVFAESYFDGPDLQAGSRVRFRLQTNAFGTADGFAVDEVRVRALRRGQDVYGTLSGTSMATAHGSGVAALVRALDPGLAAGQVRERLVDGAERTPALAGVVLSGGRLDAFRAVNGVPAPPARFAARGVSGSRIDLSWAGGYLGPVRIRIERRRSGGTDFTEIAVVDAASALWSDTAVEAGASYVYRAWADNGEKRSDTAVEAAATATAPSPSGGGGGGCFLETIAGGAQAPGFSFPATGRRPPR